MKGLSGATYRYAGSNGQLFRRVGDTQGAYTSIATGLSGQRFSIGCYRPDNSSVPYSFFADSDLMVKDNGSLTTAQRWGILQPAIPPTTSLLGVSAQIFQSAVSQGPLTDALPADQTQTTGNYAFAGTSWRTINGMPANSDAGYLYCTNFGFNIPLGATIVGVVVTFDAASELQNSGYIDHLSLCQSTTLIGSVKPSGQMLGPLGGVYSFGGNDDGWQADLTPTIVNNNTFGFAIDLFNVTGFYHMFLAAFKVTVFYIPASNSLFSSAVPIELFQSDTNFTLVNMNPSTMTVNTTTLTAITNTGYQSVMIAGDTDTVTVGMQLTFNFGGGNQEVVTVLSVNALQGNAVILANFLNTHATGETVQNLSPLQLIVATLLSEAMSEPGLQTVTVDNTSNISIGQWLTIDPNNSIEEDVLVLAVSPNGFTANFLNVHNVGAQVQAYGYAANITSSPASISKSAALGNPPSGNPWSIILDPLIQLYLNPSNPSLISEVQILLDVDDGTFTNYYTATVAGPISAGVIQIPINQFAAVGTAGTGTQLLSNVVAWQIVIVATNYVTVEFSDLWAGLAAGPSVLDGGIPYDYRYTYYNATTGAESNPSVPQTTSYYLSPINQAVVVNFTPSTDPQVTHVNIYRRGGQLNAGWYFVARVPNLSNVNTVVTDVPNASSTLTTGNYYVIVAALSGNSIIAVSPESGPISITSGVNDIHVTGPGSHDALGNPINPPGVTGWRVYFGTTSGQENEYTDFPTIVDGVDIEADGTAGTLDLSTVNQYTDFAADSTIAVNSLLEIDNDPPVTSTLLEPVDTSLGTAVTAGSSQEVLPGTMANIFQNQLITINPGGATEETVVVQQVFPFGDNAFIAFFQNPHASNELIFADTQTAAAANLAAFAFEYAWVAGDPNNPHLLYFSKAQRPESFPPQNTLEVGTPKDPIMAVVGFRGLLFVATLTTWYEVLISGGTPFALPTGCKHGLNANFAWAVSESEIFYKSYDGVYAFRAGASAYLTEPIEWIWKGQALGPVPPIAPNTDSEVLMAYGDHELFVPYTATDGTRRRLIWHDIYKRWRPDNVACESIIFEEDSSLFLLGWHDTNVADGMIFIDRQLDYDSGGYVTGVEVVNPINFSLQTAQRDQGSPKASKVYQELTIDIDTKGQDIDAYLLFDSGQSQLFIGTVNTSGRQQVQLPGILAGEGRRSLNVSLLLEGSITEVVTLYEWQIRVVVEAEYRKVQDTYWLKLGTDEFKFIKQGYFEYAAPNNDVDVFVFVDGDLTTPVYSFILPQSTTRTAIKVRFLPVKAKLWRFISNSATDFQSYDPDSHLEFKPITSAKGYAIQKLAP
jgi:hypothetical protein